MASSERLFKVEGDHRIRHWFAFLIKEKNGSQLGFDKTWLI